MVHDESNAYVRKDIGSALDETGSPVFKCSLQAYKHLMLAPTLELAYSVELTFILYSELTYLVLFL